jgi:diacylglycerol kinase family enzyme
MTPPSSGRRATALLALLLCVAVIVLTVRAAVLSMPTGPVAVLILLAAAVAVLQALVRAGAARLVALAAAAGLVAAAVLVHDVRDGQYALLVAVACAAGAALATRSAFRPDVHGAAAPPPKRPALFWNPRSGGGKAAAHRLDEEARARGITPIELVPGADLGELVRRAVADGADGLMAAGGDGTQAAVAAIAAELDLPFACIPAGTRNHFALDLGVDRDDVVGALDAFVDGWEKRVDLADINGRVFVNNVSLGVYAEAVRRPGYRERKLRSLLSTAPDVLSGTSSATVLRWTGPDGHEQTSAAVILVSNNPYRLGPRLAAGTRPRVDGGVLGIAVLGAVDGSSGRRSLVSQWTSGTFRVDSAEEVPVGLDGESLSLTPPLVIGSRPAALRARIAAHHPGASPSAALPGRVRDVVPALLALVLGRTTGGRP